MRVYYMAHPVGSDPEMRKANLERAERWLNFWIDFAPVGWMVIAPWLPYCKRIDETPENRERGLAMDCEVVGRCDGMVACGGEWSEGMKREHNSCSGDVFDFTHWGMEPPVRTGRLTLATDNAA